MEFGFTDWRALHLYCVRLLRGARVAQWRASTASSFRQLRNLTEPGLRRPGVRAPLRLPLDQVQQCGGARCVVKRGAGKAISAALAVTEALWTLNAEAGAVLRAAHAPVAPIVRSCM